jgi:hypothetical protein
MSPLGEEGEAYLLKKARIAHLELLLFPAVVLPLPVISFAAGVPTTTPSNLSYCKLPERQYTCQRGKKLLNNSCRDKLMKTRLVYWILKMIKVG